MPAARARPHQMACAPAAAAAPPLLLLLLMLGPGDAAPAPTLPFLRLGGARLGDPDTPVLAGPRRRLQADAVQVEAGGTIYVVSRMPYVNEPAPPPPPPPPGAAAGGGGAAPPAPPPPGLDEAAATAQIVALAAALDAAFASFDNASPSLTPLWNAAFWCAVAFACLLVLHTAARGVVVWRRWRMPPSLQWPRLELIAVAVIVPILVAAAAPLLAGPGAGAVAAGVAFAVVLPAALLAFACWLVLSRLVLPEPRRRRAFFLVKNKHFEVETDSEAEEEADEDDGGSGSGQLPPWGANGEVPALGVKTKAVRLSDGSTPGPSRGGTPRWWLGTPCSVVGARLSAGTAAGDETPMTPGTPSTRRSAGSRDASARAGAFFYASEATRAPIVWEEPLGGGGAAPTGGDPKAAAAAGADPGPPGGAPPPARRTRLVLRKKRKSWFTRWVLRWALGWNPRGAGAWVSAKADADAYVGRWGPLFETARGPAVAYARGTWRRDAAGRWDRGRIETLARSRRQRFREGARALWVALLLARVALFAGVLAAGGGDDAAADPAAVVITLLAVSAAYWAYMRSLAPPVDLGDLFLSVFDLAMNVGTFGCLVAVAALPADAAGAVAALGDAMVLMQTAAMAGSLADNAAWCVADGAPWAAGHVRRRLLRRHTPAEKFRAAVWAAMRRDPGIAARAAADRWLVAALGRGLGGRALLPHERRADTVLPWPVAAAARGGGAPGRRLSKGFTMRLGRWQSTLARSSVLGAISRRWGPARAPPPGSDASLGRSGSGSGSAAGRAAEAAPAAAAAAAAAGELEPALPPAAPDQTGNTPSPLPPAAAARADEASPFGGAPAAEEEGDGGSAASDAAPVEADSIAGSRLPSDGSCELVLLVDELDGVEITRALSARPGGAPPAGPAAE